MITGNGVRIFLDPKYGDGEKTTTYCVRGDHGPREAVGKGLLVLVGMPSCRLSVTVLFLEVDRWISNQSWKGALMVVQYKLE